MQNTNSNFERLAIHDFAEQAYLNYAMYVILDRALPSVADGLKPVQRRIVYSMSELGLKSTAKFKKSARTVGDVLGKFHPHSDSACYETMVLMAQPFSYRYPLIEGQGNWGAPDDPKSFAAMRYTEARLSAYSDLLLSELSQGTVQWVDNFDGTMKEPARLPAKIPNVLLNGGSGIAVGMATDIPPHNLSEIVAACELLLSDPTTSIESIRSVLPAPDLPTGGEIISSDEDLNSIYKTGLGQYRARARFVREKDCIVITELPYQTSSSKVLEQIGKQMRDKKLPWLDDIRDESDHQNPVRLALIPRSNRVDVEQLMSHLFATTNLEKSYRVNMNMIGLDGKPQVKNISMILNEWLSFRKDTIRNRLQFRLDKVDDRLHVLEGLLVAYLNIDEVIRVIRESDNPKEDLIKAFNLSERQSDFILEIKLRQLAKIEQVKIMQEQTDLAKEKIEIEVLLSSEIKLKNLIRKELKQIAKDYGNERRTSIVKRSRAQALTENQLIPAEIVTIALSKQGWIRAAKGEVDASTLSYRGTDSLKFQAIGKNNLPLVLLDRKGKSYTLNARNLPGARGHGEPLSSLLDVTDSTKFSSIIIDQVDSNYLLSATDGYGFVVPYDALLNRTKKGKNIVNLSDNSKLLKPQKTDDMNWLMCVSNEGNVLVFSIDELGVLNRGRGHKLIGIISKKEESMTHNITFKNNDDVIVWSGKRKMYLRWKDINNIISNRGKRGKPLPRGFSKVSQLEVFDKIKN